MIQPRSKGLFGYFVNHRTAANLLLVLMVIAGLWGMREIRAQFFPDTVIERISVSASWPGAGAEDIDLGIIEVLEPAVMAVNGVDTVTSTAREGSASISIEFTPGYDMAIAEEDVKTAIDGAQSLPEDVEDPVITRAAFTDRVTDIVVSGPVGVDLLSRYADELKSALFRRGVTRVEISGVADPIIRVEPREADLEREQLTHRAVADAITAAYRATPAGDLDAAGARVRVGEERRTAEEIGAIPLSAQSDGSRLILRDVARVYEEGLDRGVAYYRDGEPAVVVTARRDAAGNAIKLQSEVEAAVAELAPTLPQGVRMELAKTRSAAISGRLDILVSNGLVGIGLVLAMLFLFLSFRTAFWVAAGVPTAMIATIGLMYAAGLTINMISLFALIICLGIVVDDAIVIGEHADHLAQQGLPPAEAAERAAQRMAGPVFSSSITTIIAFSGLVMIGGRFGNLIADIPFTVAAVLVASLVEVFLILPAHMKHALEARARHPHSRLDVVSRSVNRGFNWFRSRVFRPFMRGAIVLRYVMLSLAIMLFLFTIAALRDSTVPWRFFAPPERGVVSANIVMLPGSAREDTMAMLAEMRRALDAVDGRYAEEHGTAPVVMALAKAGGTVGWGFDGAENRDTDLLGGFEIELIDPDLRSYTQRDFIKAWQDEIVNHSQLERLAMRGSRSGPGGDAINVQLSGADAPTLKAAAEAIKAPLSRMEGVSGLDDTLDYDKTELIVRLTPRGEALGLTGTRLASELRNRLQGIEAAEFARDRRSVTVRVAAPEDETGADYLQRARIALPSGLRVSLSEVALIESRQGFASIRREDGRRLVTLTGEIADDAAAETAVREALTETILPDVAARFDVDYVQGGLAEQERNFLSDAMIGFAMALAGIYITLCWIFASWTRPVVVMLIIPFGLIGAVWGHWVHDVPLSMFSIVGLIGMSGILINDSIVLVTTIDEYAEKRGLIPSVIDGAADRLRAVLLTTLTTVFGLAPLLFEKSIQAQFLKPTVITLAYGLGFGLLLVLVVTPSIIAIQHDVGNAARSARRLVLGGALRRRGFSPRSAPEPEIVPFRQAAE